jgi:hypothetical protein
LPVQYFAALTAIKCTVPTKNRAIVPRFASPFFLSSHAVLCPSLIGCNPAPQMDMVGSKNGAITVCNGSTHEYAYACGQTLATFNLVWVLYPPKTVHNGRYLAHQFMAKMIIFLN